jgi:hypothetical protein
VDGPALTEILEVLDAAAGGKRRILARVAARAEIDASSALQELGALPTSSCSAIEAGVGLTPSRCTAGSGCAVEAECPLVRGGEPGRMRASALAELVRRLVARARKPMAEAPVADLAGLAEGVDALLAASERVGPDAPPRARTSMLLLQVATRRGGPFAAVNGFLTAAELEQVAAFVPPGSAREAPSLAPVEAWLRRAATDEVGLVEV